MFDFVSIKYKATDAKYTKFEVYPEFLVKKSKDLMTKGKSFYAVWDAETERWCKDEEFVQEIVDAGIFQKVNELKELYPGAKDITGKYLANFSSNKWCEWQKYIKSLPDNYHDLDSTVTFANDKPKKTDYISKSLPYDMVDEPCPSYDELMDVLYSPEERRKLEWAIGAIISGDSKHIQKFLVLYGPPKSGKSTFLKIVQKMFQGYYSTFEAKALGSVNNPFALEAFRDNPLLVIQHDGDLSKIEDNTKINQIVAHEDVVVNEKFKATYATRFNSFLILGTNKPVRITDAKSGIIRRLIDVEPTGNTVGYEKYRSLMKQIDFELGAIANHCLKLYLELGENYYDPYKPLKMMGATNVVYNFLFDKYFEYKARDYIPLSEIWLDYKNYCDDGNHYKMSKMAFKEELKTYFAEFKDHTNNSSNVYSKLIAEKFIKTDRDENVLYSAYKINFNKRISMFDEWAKDMQLPAQYANEDGTPEKKWDDVTTTLEDIDSSKVHYIRLPSDHIVIDFDLKDENGNKCFAKNWEAASKWPQTYAELSKSTEGIHLHYIYSGDVRKLERIYDNNPDIEIKVFTGKSALRRKLTKCNDIPIATISSGLPLKEEKRVVTEKGVKDERHLRNLIVKNIKKEIHPGTKPSVDFIYDILEEAYKSGMTYDVSDMANDVLIFASGSTNHSQYCLKKVSKMHFTSDDNVKVREDGIPTHALNDDKPIAFFDVEVFPNVFILCWKYAGDTTVTRMINPRPSEVEWLFKNLRMIGFNNRRYDNHICWAWMQGYTNYGLYELSQKIIVTKKGEKSTGFFGQAYNASYLDVYDLASNPNKMSLKKWEIKLHMYHLENSYPWDQDLPEDKWFEVCDYCENDVKATEAVYNSIMGDVAARLILSRISGLLPNDTTNNHSMQIIFGNDMEPQSQFKYTNLSVMFPSYTFDNGVSTYRGYIVGEGGFVWAKPGIYRKVKTFDIASMHPSSLIALGLFGPAYTQRFKEIKDARIAVKHRDRKALETLLGGQLLEFYDIAEEGKEYTLKDLATALKTVINSVYGLTYAGFSNRCRDPRNVDNIVAKRGALFMVNLKEEVEKRGGNVIHIKTDSIKVVNPSPEIEEFIISYGKEYGYDFEVESIYDRICLVNDAVYIAQYDDGEHEYELPTGEKILTSWTATGTEFRTPYIFKTLFADKEINLYDLAVTQSVSKGELYLDFNENLPEDEHAYQFIGKVSSFLPIKPGKGGATMIVKRDDKCVSASGAKGVRWLETEYVKNADRLDDIDMSYYENLAKKAIDHINEFGDFEKFRNDPDYDPYLESCINVPLDVDEEVPFDEDKVVA